MLRGFYEKSDAWTLCVHGCEAPLETDMVGCRSERQFRYGGYQRKLGGGRQDAKAANSSGDNGFLTEDGYRLTERD
ncbi:unnamed protein product [Sphenostylis stenocarpa]|uniref:Uncharacterized protein n=1 Tax=Sphenostylis stenocarpa TaxID=92480 RepID=A0AA86TEN0_9FABA|nr:unnamed protein product [Sphenostylis stenocarpa]